MCNLWDLVCMLGGLFGGVVVVVVVGIVFVVGVFDGGGLICILVVYCGLFGLCFLCGCVFCGLVDGEYWEGVFS